MRSARTRRLHAPIRLLALTASLASIALASALPASAATDDTVDGTSVTVDSGWQQFATDGEATGTSVEGPYTFVSTSLTKVTVTDSYCVGDEFSVFDNGVLLGDTSVVPAELQACPIKFFTRISDRADTSMVDPTFSHGSFYVAPGSHSLELVNKAIAKDTTGDLGAFFRLETTPLDKMDCKAGGWGNYGTLFTNQGECVSLSNALGQRTAANVGTVSFETSPFGTVARGLTPPDPSWHTWEGPFRHYTKYVTKHTVPITQAAGNEVLTVTVPVFLSGAGEADPATTTVTLTMTAQNQFLSWIPTAQYGSLGNDAWELVGDPTVSDPSMETTWTFRSTSPLVRGADYDPIVISFDLGSPSSFNNVAYTFTNPHTAIASATADGYATGTGSGWYALQK